MKEYKIGTFFGKDVYVKADFDFNWAEKWKEYLEAEKKMAVEEYKSDLFLKEIDKAKNSCRFKFCWKDLFKKKQ